MYSDFYTRCTDVDLTSRESPLEHLLAKWANSVRLDGDEHNPEMSCTLSPRIASFPSYKWSCWLPFPDADAVGFPVMVVIHIAPLGFSRRMGRSLVEGGLEEIVASKDNPGCNVRTELSCWKSRWNSLAKVKNGNPNESRWDHFYIYIHHIYIIYSLRTSCLYNITLIISTTHLPVPHCPAYPFWLLVLFLLLFFFFL